MTTAEQDPAWNHRRQRSLLATASLAVLLLGMAPRQERALFITDGAGLKALGVTVPLVDYAALASLPRLVDAVGPRGFFARLPAEPSGASGAPAVGDPAAGAAPFVPAEQPAGVGGGPVLQDAAVPAFGSPGTAFPFSPASLAAPGASPAVPIAAAPAASDSPTPVASPTPAATPTPTPVAAVPEPGTWLLMMIGFFGIGTMLRRSRRATEKLGRPAGAGY